MTEVSSFFTEKYKALVEKLTNEQFENFKNAETEADKIKILYPFLKDIIIKPGIYGKNYDEALKQKNAGNSYFAKKDNEWALECYTKGIIKCPQDTTESQQLLAVLLANRSACLFELEEFEKALADIECVKYIDAYPIHLKYKLFLREAKCRTEMKHDIDLVLAAYKATLEFLKSSALDENVIKMKKHEVDMAIKNLSSLLKEKKGGTATSSDNKCISFERNQELPNASAAVTIAHHPALGRYACADADIDIGAIVVSEPAYCAVLAPDFMLTNCQYCMKATNTPVPCSKCANVVFCSLKCKDDALNYHQFECGMHPTLFETGASINCLMALRIISQHDIEYFLSISEETETDRNFLQTASCDPHGYLKIYKLCRHEHLRKQEEYFHYTIMAIYLLRVLQTSTYFNLIINDDVLSKNEIFVGTMILQNLQMLQFNAHEISELREAPPGPLDPKDEQNFKAIYIGGGLYPTIALFNHSCDPGIVRYNVGSRMIVEVIKPILKGQAIYENYGPIYTNVIRCERRKFLKERYWFDCVCQACTEDWPLFKEMEESVVKIPCQKASCKSYALFHGSVQSPAIPCLECGNKINLFPPLQALSTLEDLLQQAELLYKRRKYIEAMKQYKAAMRIYSKHTMPPFPDWVKVQQRLRTCMVSRGNKCIEYNKIFYNK